MKSAKFRNDGPKSEIYKEWLLGYLSGLASSSGVNILGDKDEESIYLWIDNYCKANPLDTLSDGSNELFGEQEKKMHKSVNQ